MTTHYELSREEHRAVSEAARRGASFDRPEMLCRTGDGHAKGTRNKEMVTCPACLAKLGTRVFGSELRVGDTIEVWWTPNRDTITALRPYVGVYSETILKGAQLADFALNKTGMTIEAGALFTRLN